MTCKARGDVLLCVCVWGGGGLECPVARLTYAPKPGDNPALFKWLNKAPHAAPGKATACGACRRACLKKKAGGGRPPPSRQLRRPSAGGAARLPDSHSIPRLAVLRAHPAMAHAAAAPLLMTHLDHCCHANVHRGYRLHHHRHDHLLGPLHQNCACSASSPTMCTPVGSITCTGHRQQATDQRSSVLSNEVARGCGLLTNQPCGLLAEWWQQTSADPRPVFWQSAGYSTHCVNLEWLSSMKSCTGPTRTSYQRWRWTGM